MLCCGTVALAASLILAVGRRIALVLMVAGGVLIDPTALVGHAQAMIFDGAICLGG
jgi:hypothetical protein